MQSTYRRKLIEVDLPLDDINRESAREKSIRHGHPSTLHLWWARRPLATCRAVIFASMVDDPSDCADEFPTEEEQRIERERLHDLICKLVKWEATDERKPESRAILNEARFEIAKSVARSKGEVAPPNSPAAVLRYLDDKTLPIYDPFAGGGSIPLEAQRLGLRAVASDLNPVAVLINKALIELPPKFSGKPPINPGRRSELLGERVESSGESSGESSELGGERVESSGESSELGGERVESSGESSELGGESNESSGKSSELGGESNESSGESSELGGESNESSGESSELGGESNESSGKSSELGGESNESSDGDSAALSQYDTVAEGDGHSARSVSPNAQPAASGNLRHALPDNEGSGIRSGEHSGGLDAGDPEGQGELSGDSSRILGGNGDPAHSLRRPSMVPDNRDPNPEKPAGRSEQNADHNAAQSTRENSRESARERKELRGVSNERFVSTSQSSLLKTHSSPWRGAAGLADDIRYYGRWMREEAFKSIGHLYPKAKLPDGGEATVIAWLWARTVPCPNPACGVQMPLMTTFQLSRKRGNEHWTRPIVVRSEVSHAGNPQAALSAGRSESNADDNAPSVSEHPQRADTLNPLAHSYRLTPHIKFEVQNHSEGIPMERTVIRGGKGAVCLACSGSVTHAYIREQSRAGNMGEQMTAIVAEGDRKRLFFSPSDEHIQTAYSAEPNNRSIPQQKMPTTAYKVSGRGYGIEYWRELFTQRQLTTLTTFSELLPRARASILDAGASAEYADTVCTYLALAVGRTANSCSSYARWQNSGDFVAGVFARQAIPMMWDFAESNPYCTSSQNWTAQIEWIAKVMERLPANVSVGKVHQADASTTIHANTGPVIVTDPPYYDNISYAELSDFFYVWLRPLLRDIYPNLFAGILVPIQEEMIAAPRFNDKTENARARFERLMGETLTLIRQRCSPEFPSSIFYAYKQQDHLRDGVTSTGWDTMLTSLVQAGFQIVSTWPMRTERSARSNALGANTLASSVVLVCRPRPEDAPVVGRGEFLDALNTELPAALDRLTHESHINPVDLRQAAIGPGMSVYSRYGSIETLSGEVVSVREALMAINDAVDEYMEREDGQLDTESRFCLDWLRAHPDGDGRYGDAENLARVHNLVVEERLEQAHNLLTADAGDVHLLSVDEYTPERRYPAWAMTAWEGCMRMAWHMGSGDERGGVDGCADALNRADGLGDIERLARILYDFYDQRRDSQRAVMFNSVVASWDAIAERAAELKLGSNRLFQ